MKEEKIYSESVKIKENGIRRKKDRKNKNKEHVKKQADKLNRS